MNKTCNKLTAGAAALALMVSGLGFLHQETGNSGSSAFAAESQQMDYLALGDSISAAYGLASPETEGFTYLIADEMQYTLSNRAVSGYTSDDIYAQLESGALDDEIADAELITITCGGNDFMQMLYARTAARYNEQMKTSITSQDVVDVMLGTSSAANRTMLILCAKWVLQGEEDKGTPPFAESPEFEAELAEYTASMGDVMAYIRRLNEHANIIMATQYNPYKHFAGSDYEVLALGCGAGAKRLSETIADNAEAFGYVTADVYTVFEASEENLCNAAIAPLNVDYHPNAAGHAVIAETFLSVLETLPEPEPPTTEPTEPTISVVGYRYEAQCREQFYIAEDDREFDAADLITELSRREVYSDGSESETAETITDLSVVDFGGASPKQVYAQQDAAYYTGGITATIADAFGEQKLTMDTVRIGVKGDANLDGALNAGDASAILVYATLMGANMERYLYSKTDTEMERFAYFLADVTGESADHGADGSALDSIDAANVLVFAAAQGADGTADWTEVLRS